MKRVLYHGCRLLLAGVFLYAGYLKGIAPIAFAGQVATYQLLPYAFNYLVAATLPFVELLCGALLLINRRIRPALLVLFGLNGIFILALISLIARDLDIDCGCFKPGAEGDAATSPQMALLRDVGLMLAILGAWWFKPAGQPEAVDD